MKTKLFIVLLMATLNTAIYSQDITNTLGTNGSFIIKDGSTTFFTLDQATGYLTLNKSLSLPYTTSSAIGVIYKGSGAFIHDYQASNADGGNTFVGINSGNFTMSRTGGAGTGEASYNSAFGEATLTNLTTGHRNSAFGVNSLQQNTIGYQNAAFGRGTLSHNISGNDNSAFGESAMTAATTGSSNSAFGRYAGYLITTGNNNIVVGYNAQVPDGALSNQVRIGDGLISYAGIEVAWTITSDRKLKSNIVNSNLGLDFISKLRPVSYTRRNDKSQKTEYGFIAQEVEELLKSNESDNTGMTSKDAEGTYSMRYNDLFAPLVKAIQDLKKENDQLKAKNEVAQVVNDKLKTTTIELNARLTKFEKMQSQLVSEIEKIKAYNNETTQVSLGGK